MWRALNGFFSQQSIGIVLRWYRFSSKFIRGMKRERGGQEYFIICLERTSVALEYAIGGTTIFQLIHAHLPLPVVSLLLRTGLQTII